MGQPSLSWGVGDDSPEMRLRRPPDFNFELPNVVPKKLALKYKIRIMDEFQSISQLKDHHITQLVDLYKNEFWSHQRTRPGVEKMLAASDVVIALVDGDDRLTAFTRVLTDFVYRATIYDVIVNPIDRQKGLGKRIMDEVLHHPKLAQVEHFALFCLPEMMPFYERWGFAAIDNLQLMGRYSNSQSSEVQPGSGS